MSRKTGPTHSPATAGQDTTSLPSLEQHAQEETLRQANHRLQRELSKLREDRTHVIEAVTEAIQLAASGIIIPPVELPKPAKSRSDRKEEKAIYVLSDTQLGKLTPTYNTEVCAKRLDTYLDAATTITNIQRVDHEVNDAYVIFGGDMIEGELIFPHQQWQLDSSMFAQTFSSGPAMFIKFIRGLLAIHRHVTLVCVPGNHGNMGGRQGKAYSPETNGDRMLYVFMQALLAREPRLTWRIVYEERESGWYDVSSPWPNWPILSMHGYNMPSPASASMATIARRIWGYSSGAIQEPFKIVISCHWHSPKHFLLNELEVFYNGSTESTNLFAQERLSAMGQPMQLMFFLHPTRGVTAQYWLKLDKRITYQAKHAPAAVAYEPVEEPKL